MRTVVSGHCCWGVGSFGCNCLAFRRVAPRRRHVYQFAKISVVFQIEQRAFDVPGLTRPTQRRVTMHEVFALHRALEPFIDLQQLRRCVAAGRNVYQALRVDRPPQAVRALLHLVTAVLQLIDREQIRNPRDIAGLLMAEMSYLDQEELRTILLDTKNRVQDIVTVYRGSLNMSIVRIGEIYKDALKRNSAAIVLVHNHPSGDPTPSPDDVLMTREVVQAGELLDVAVLDHLVIGQGKWVSLRERGLGF